MEHQQKNLSCLAEVLSHLHEIQCRKAVKRACIFHLILFGILYPSWYCPLRTEDGFFLLKRENPLSLTKVTCWQSLLLFNSHLIYACQVWGKKTVIKACVRYFLIKFLFFHQMIYSPWKTMKNVFYFM